MSYFKLSEINDAAKSVLKSSKHVKINKKNLEKFSNELDLTYSPDKVKNFYVDINGLEAASKMEYLFLFHSVNFCFWSSDFDPVHDVYYEKEEGKIFRTGGFANAIWDIFNDKAYKVENIKDIFKKNLRNFEYVNLTNKRIENMLEVIKFVDNDGVISFLEAIDQNNEIESIGNYILDEFYLFYDVSAYKGQLVPFFKRLQAFLIDIHFYISPLVGIDNLTALADYRLPQLLNFYGILEYSDMLSYKVKNNVLLLPHEASEIEIRAATIIAVEEIFKIIETQSSIKSVIDLDYLLWRKARETDKISIHPFHRTIGDRY